MAIALLARIVRNSSVNIALTTNLTPSNLQPAHTCPTASQGTGGQTSHAALHALALPRFQSPCPWATEKAPGSVSAYAHRTPSSLARAKVLFLVKVFEDGGWCSTSDGVCIWLFVYASNLSPVGLFC